MNRSAAKITPTLFLSRFLYELQVAAQVVTIRKTEVYNGGGSSGRGRSSMPAFAFVDDILRPYMRECSSDKRISTQKAECCCADRLVEFFGGDFITFADAKFKRAINGSRVRAYREHRKTVGSVSPLTVKRELALASKACNYAIAEWDYSMPNPFAKRLISDKDARAVKGVKRKRVITREEQSAIESQAPPTVQDIVAFGVKTGLRQGEIIRLRWDQIFGNEIRFNPEDQKNGTHGKRGMDSTALEIVSRQPKVSEYVFTLNGNRWGQRHLQRLWSRARDLSGVENVKFKDLRKTCGSRMLGEGKARMEDVKTQLGHNDIRTTQEVYAEDSIENAIEILERVA